MVPPSWLITQKDDRSSITSISFIEKTILSQVICQESIDYVNASLERESQFFSIFPFFLLLFFLSLGHTPVSSHIQ